MLPMSKWRSTNRQYVLHMDSSRVWMKMFTRYTTHLVSKMVSITHLHSTGAVFWNGINTTFLHHVNAMLTHRIETMCVSFVQTVKSIQSYYWSIMMDSILVENVFLSFFYLGNDEKKNIKISYSINVHPFKATQIYADLWMCTHNMANNNNFRPLLLLLWCASLTIGWNGPKIV